MRHHKVALVLGSGAARGWAHIGAIRALEEMKVSIDIVTGTSIGSLVGGAYAAEKLDVLERWVLDLDRWGVVGLLDFGLTSGGVISGEKVFNFAREKLGSLQISQLQKSYAAVATDLYTGHEVWLKEGDLIQASRASCAMPGVLSPKALNGRWLVDGGLVNPVPVSLARALDADFVIAIHLNTQIKVADDGLPAHTLAPETQALTKKTLLPTKDEQLEKNSQASDNLFLKFLNRSQDYFESVKEKLLPSSPGVLGVMAGSIDIMQERITRARLASDPPDILLQPKLGEIGLLEFEKAEKAIEIGYQTTMKMQDAILEEIELMKIRSQIFKPNK